MADRFFIFNEIFGTVLRYDHLPEGVSLGLRQIGPSYNNGPAPVLFVTKRSEEMHTFLVNHRLKNGLSPKGGWTLNGLEAIPLNSLEY